MDDVLHERVREIIESVPAGTVATYGDIAALAGAPSPRMVGAILANGGTIENPEPGFEYLKKLRGKVVTYPASGGESLSLIQKGEVGLVTHHSEANLYNKFFNNAPIEVVVPKEGMPLSALSRARTVARPSERPSSTTRIPPR